MSLPREQTQPPPESGPLDDAEQAMRRALGLFGEASRPKPDTERAEPTARMGGGFMPGLHRRRFVQDGEVPVTVVRHTQDPGHSAGPNPPTTSRLQRVEAALTAETQRADRAERALHEAQAAVQAIRTKMGHNELATNEALAASKRHIEEVAASREELATAREQLREMEERAQSAEDELNGVRAELNEERRARKLAERLLRETSQESAYVPLDTPVPPVHHDVAERMPSRRSRAPAHMGPEADEEPVKWWLMPSKAAVKKR